MGKVIIQEETTKKPITLMGKEAGVCRNSNTEDGMKNYKRGINCLKTGHGRTFEFPQIYMILDGYSVRMVREFYTHIGGMPTRLQESTRYVDYQNGFDYVMPSNIFSDGKAREVYIKAMNDILNALKKLERLNTPREDSALLLPLGMKTKVVVRTNLRNLIDMSGQRICSRAYHEYREFMKDLIKALNKYSDEWEYITANFFKPKCEISGFCNESKSCGNRPLQTDI